MKLFRRKINTSSNYKKNKAFTLVEILITIGIIGVIAAIVIPIINNQIQNNIHKTAYKNAFNVATQAWQKAALDNNIPTRATWLDSMNSNFDVFMSYFTVTKTCKDNNNSECWPPDNKWYTGTTPYDDAYAFVDNAGRSWSTLYNGSGKMGQSLCVDTNGFKKPNQVGKDTFCFNLLNADNSTEAGIPIKIVPRADMTTSNTYCTQPPCYNTSWLTE